jgi:hypothetical protein
MRRLSRRLNDAPFALASDGRVYVNITHFDQVHTIADAVARARRERGTIFIGVDVKQAEGRDALARLAHAYRNAAAYLVGARQRRPRPKGR